MMHTRGLKGRSPINFVFCFVMLPVNVSEEIRVKFSSSDESLTQTVERRHVDEG